MVDTKARIARSNIYSIFGKLMNRLINNNDDGEVILKKAGLSSYVEQYDNKLSPYWYNRGYQNQNDAYNPEYACMSICEKIEADEEALLRFLNTILDDIYEIDEKHMTIMKQNIILLYHQLQVFIREILMFHICGQCY